MLIKSAWFPIVLAPLALTCDDAAGPPDDISGACERQRECAAKDGNDVIGSDRDECPERLSAEYDEASSYGCGAAYAEWVRCQATQRGSCPPPVMIGEIAADGSGADSANEAAGDADPCQGANDAFRLCQGMAQPGE